MTTGPGTSTGAAAAPPAPHAQARRNSTPGFDAPMVLQGPWTFSSNRPPSTPRAFATTDCPILANSPLPKHTTWKQLFLTTPDGTPITAKYTTRRQHAGGISTRPSELITQLDPAVRAFREPGWGIISDPQPPPRAPPAELQEKSARLHGAWFTQDAAARMHAFLLKAQRDGEHSGTNHRPRLMLGRRGSELRIGPDDYAPLAREILALGWTLIDDEGTTRIIDPSDLSDMTWSFHAALLRDKAAQIDWPDVDIRGALTFGFRDHSDRTPPVTTASPHQAKAYQHITEFDRLVRKEIEHGWYSAPTPHPRTLPSRLSPGSLEPKATKGKFRLIRNSSWPAPGTLDSAITRNNTTTPLATNDNTTLPGFMSFEWTSTATNNDTVVVLSSLSALLGTSVVGTTTDFTDWFRQFAIAKDDYWKSSVLTCHGARIDKRLQMGRRSSALHGQRLSFLVGELIEREAELNDWGLHGLNTKQRAIAREWQDRRAHLGPRQARLVKLGPFQDDITFLTVSAQAGPYVLEASRRFMTDTLGIELSTKPEATRPFCSRFSAIGASYDTSSPAPTTVQPKPALLLKLKTAIDEMRAHEGRLAPLMVAQSWVGLAQFTQQFVTDGRFLLNSSYLALRASPHLRTRSPKVPISTQMIVDISELWREATRTPKAIIPSAQPVWDKGAFGPFVDATAPHQADGRGWGVVMGPTFARGAWPAHVTQLCRSNALSINQLELLAVAIGIDVFARDGMLPTDNVRTVVRGDNIGARDNANKWTADGPVMACILRILWTVCKRHGVRVWMVHVSTTDNAVADGLSRSPHLHQADGRLHDRKSPPDQLDDWLADIARVAVAQPRHSTGDTERQAHTDEPELDHEDSSNILAIPGPLPPHHDHP